MDDRSRPPIEDLGQTTQQPQQVKVNDWTMEEREIIKQWRHDSFYYRCLPYSLAGMGFMEILARRRGLATAGITRHFAALGAGFIMGKASYGAELKKRLCAVDGGFYASQLEESKKQLAEEKGISLEDSSADDKLLLPTRRGGKSEFDSTSPFVQAAENQQAEPGSSRVYDELRKKSRAEFQASSQQPPSQSSQRRGGPYVNPAAPGGAADDSQFHQDVSVASPGVSQTNPRQQNPRQQKRVNKFGDVWDEDEQ